MYQKPCRLSKADKYYGPGGGSAPTRSPGAEFPVIKDFTHGEEGLLNQFVRGQPLFAQAQSFLNQIQPILDQSKGLLTSSVGMAKGTADSIAKYIMPILQSGGALTPEQERDVSQASRATEGASGMLHTNAGIGTELLNREGAQEQRYDRALTDVGAGINQQGSVIGQAGAVTGQELGAQGGALSQESTQVQSFAALEDPILSYLGNLFGENLQSQSAAATANTNKTAGVESGALQAIGSIAGAGIKASDIRLKEKIRDIGEKTPEGIPIKTFRYKGDPTKQRFIGVLSKDVKKKVPSAVIKGPGGFDWVDFSKINTVMLPVAAAA